MASAGLNHLQAKLVCCLVTVAKLPIVRRSGCFLREPSNLAALSPVQTVGCEEVHDGQLLVYVQVLLGDMGAGKSSLVLRFVKGQFFDFQVSRLILAGWCL